MMLVWGHEACIRCYNVGRGSLLECYSVGRESVHDASVGPWSMHHMLKCGGRESTLNVTMWGGSLFMMLQMLQHGEENLY